MFAALGVGFVCYAVQFWLYPFLQKRWLAHRSEKGLPDPFAEPVVRRPAAAGEVEVPEMPDGKGD